MLRKNKRDLGKALYFMYREPSDIAKETGTHLATVYDWIKLWKEEREQLTHTYIISRLEKSARGIASCLDVSVPLIQKSIIHRYRAALDAEGNMVNPLKIHEIKALTEVVTALDKLLRLDAGRPTDIVEAQGNFAPVTLQELRDAVKNDYFIGAIPLKKGREYEEIEDDGSKVVKGQVEQHDPSEEHEGGSAQPGSGSDPNGGDTGTATGSPKKRKPKRRKRKKARIRTPKADPGPAHDDPERAENSD